MLCCVSEAFYSYFALTEVASLLNTIYDNINNNTKIYTFFLIKTKKVRRKLVSKLVSINLKPLTNH